MWITKVFIVKIHYLVVLNRSSTVGWALSYKSRVRQKVLVRGRGAVMIISLFFLYSLFSLPNNVSTFLTAGTAVLLSAILSEDVFPVRLRSILYYPRSPGIKLAHRSGFEASARALSFLFFLCFSFLFFSFFLLPLFCFCSLQFRLICRNKQWLMMI